MSSASHRKQTRVGLLGLGLMGSAMARRLLDQGFPTVVWDRSPEKVKALESAGAEPAENAEDVVREVDLVITMLPTADIVLEVVEPLLEDWPQETIWVQMSSVGANEADQLTWTAKSHGVTLIDAPVSGSTRPALEGQLTVLASGPGSAARAVVGPVFDALASRVLWLGEAGMGSRLKLAANHWMIAKVAVLAESMRLCEAMGLDQRHFVALLDGGPLGSQYASQKLDEILRHEYPAGFPVRLAVKDLELVEEVQRSAPITMPLLDAVLKRFVVASQDFADQDLAAIYEIDGPR
jgi:3-hydroxyisobutyrate dehydrogenase